MHTNEGVVVEGPGKVVIKRVPYPTFPHDDSIIIKTTAVAINPTDWKHVHNTGDASCAGCIVGMDAAGIVEEVGPGVTKPFKKGDRVAGTIHGSNKLNKDIGAYARYSAGRQNILSKIPDNMSNEEAATQGVALGTIGLSLYYYLGIPWPTEPAKEPFDIFIYGGSTAMGICGIQFAKLSGGRVITTASPANTDYVKSLGADHVLDYKSETLVDDLIALTGGQLKRAFDCHSDKNSLEICIKALKAPDSHLISLLPNRDYVKSLNPNLKHDAPLGYDMFGEDYYYHGHASPGVAKYEYMERFMPMAWELLASGKVKPPRVILNRGGSGLEGVVTGLEELRQGRVSGGKLVYTL